MSQRKGITQILLSFIFSDSSTSFMLVHLHFISFSGDIFCAAIFHRWIYLQCGREGECEKLERRGELHLSLSIYHLTVINPTHSHTLTLTLTYAHPHALTHAHSHASSQALSSFQATLLFFYPFTLQNFFLSLCCVRHTLFLALSLSHTRTKTHLPERENECVCLNLRLFVFLVSKAYPISHIWVQASEVKRTARVSWLEKSLLFVIKRMVLK